MLINSRNEGRDSTLEPAYLTKRPKRESGGDISELYRLIEELRTELHSVEEQCDGLENKINQTDTKVDELTEQISGLQSSIANLQAQIDEINSVIAQIDDHQPIELSFIDALEPYNSQEGEG